MKPSPQAYDLSESPHPKYALTRFSPEEFQRFWPGISDMLDKIPHTWKLWTKDHIFASAMNDVIQVWGIGPPPQAVLIFFTQISRYPTKSVLCVVWGAGRFEREMLPLLKATLMNYAKLSGCTSIEVRGRRGWEPFLKSIGMKRDFVTWSIDVPDMRMN